MKLRNTAALGLCIAMTGCVSAPQPKQAPPVAIASTMSVVLDRMPTDPEKYSATGLDGTYFGAAGAQGSAAVGVMFGLIGVLANVAHINAQNRSNAQPLADLTSLNLSAVLREQIGSTAGAGYELVPSASLFFTDKTSYYMGCAVTAHQPASKWQARYAVAVEGLRTTTDASDTQSAKDALGPCLKRAHELFAGHVDGTLRAFEQRTVTSPRIDGKGNLDMPMQVAVAALPDRVIAQDFLGLSELRKNQVVAIK